MNLLDKSKKLESLFKNKDIEIMIELETLFEDWSYQVILMRLRQEYETIKGLIISTAIEKKHGLSHLQKAMEKVQKRFGKETVNIALDETLKVGLRREKLRTIMQSITKFFTNLFFIAITIKYANNILTAGISGIM